MRRETSCGERQDLKRVNREIPQGSPGSLLYVYLDSKGPGVLESVPLHSLKSLSPKQVFHLCTLPFSRRQKRH